MKKKFALNLILIILLLTPTTSIATIINYTMSPVDPFYISTPEGSYSANLSGNVLIDSEGKLSASQNPYYTYDIIAFALTFDIPELNEILAFAGTGDSDLRILDTQCPWDYTRLDIMLNLNGAGNFSGLRWHGRTIAPFNGDLPQSIYVSADMSFYGDGGLDGWDAPVLGKDNWILHGNDGDVMLTQTPVPEPATMVLLGIGLVGLVGLKKRKQ